MAKTPAKIANLITRHQDRIEWIADILRVKRTLPLENQADHVRDNSEDYWIGMAVGANATLEEALHEHKCYAGFMHVGEPKRNASGVTSWTGVKEGDPEYADWRRHYFTKVF